MRAVHGDDIFGAGLREEVLKLVALLKKRWRTWEQLIGLRDQQELHIPIENNAGAETAWSLLRM